MKAPALGRPFDWSYATNRFILLATPVIGTAVGIGALFRGEALPDAAWWGFYAGGASFMSWAIAVELHPDRPWIGAVATVLAPFGLLWGTAALLVCASVLLAARAVAGTTGRSFRPADLVLLALVAVPAAGSDAAPAALVAGTLGLGATALWHRIRRENHVAAAGVYAVAAGVSLFLADGLGLPPSDEMTIVWVGIGAGLLSLFGPAPVTAPTDRAGGTVVALRVRLARVLVAVAAVGVSLTVGPAPVAPLWAALMAIAVVPR